MTNEEQTNPSNQQQEDGYSGGVDLVGLIAGEFGLSRLVVSRQIQEANVEILIDDKPFVPEDKRQALRVPYELAKDKTITVVGKQIHWRMKFRG